MYTVTFPIIQSQTLCVESMVQVVGRRTPDQNVPNSNPETGLNFQSCGETLK